MISKMKPNCVLEVWYGVSAARVLYLLSSDRYASTINRPRCISPQLQDDCEHIQSFSARIVVSLERRTSLGKILSNAHDTKADRHSSSFEFGG